jgi:hypothetical protein
MLLNCRRRHRFQRKDAIHDLVPIDGVQARPEGRKQKAMSQWNGTGGTAASAPPKGPPRGAYFGQAASPPAPRGFAQPIGAGSDSQAPHRSTRMMKLLTRRGALIEEHGRT